MILLLSYLVAGIGMLTLGGEALIRGALGVAKGLKVSPLLSGLVIVGFGTSMPELVVSIEAALAGEHDIAIGNVVGSNIANILLILGVCALITPLMTSMLVLKRDAITTIAVSAMFVWFAWDGRISALEGVLFLLVLFAYLVWVYWSEKSGGAPSAVVHQGEAEVHQRYPRSMGGSILIVLVGLAFLIMGSRVLLLGAIGLAKDLGIPETIIGLTLVAVGTSLPELTISIMAALKRQTEVAIGNVLGSNIFNILGILGLSALLEPLGIEGRILMTDQWVMLGTACLTFFFLLSGRVIDRLEGGLLLLGYVIYAGLSFLYTTHR